MPVFGGPDPTPSTSSSSLPIAPPAPSPPPSSSSLAPSSPTRTLSPAAAAALARAQPAPRPTSRAEAHSARLDQEGGEEFRPDRKDLLAYHRVLDSQFLPNVSKTQAVETLSTLHTILSNLLSPPAPSQAHKYRHIRLSNPLIQRIILTPASGSAKDFLVLCGWKREVKEFEEALVWRGGEGQVYRVRCGRLVVEGKLRAAKEAEERERRYKESEKEAEAARKEKALLAYEEDRLSRAERDERERLVREARAALPSPPVIPRPTAHFPSTPPPPRIPKQGRTTPLLRTGSLRALTRTRLQRRCRFPVQALPSPIGLAADDVCGPGIVRMQLESTKWLAEKGYASGMGRAIHLAAKHDAATAARLNDAIDWDYHPVAQRKIFVEKMREWGVAQGLTAADIDILLRYEVYDYHTKWKKQEQRSAEAEAKPLKPHPIKRRRALTTESQNVMSYSDNDSDSRMYGTHSFNSVASQLPLPLPSVAFSPSSYLAAGSYGSGSTTATDGGRTASDPLTHADSSTSTATDATAFDLPTPPSQFYGDQIDAPSASTSRNNTSTTPLDDRS
ncbi:hypothetical protein NBRC10512v2_001372 [Rhodotorula toruloides]